MENSIEEALEKLSTGKKIKMYELLRIFKREGIENFVTTRKKYVDVILSDYKRALKENEELKQDRNNNYQMIALAKNEMLGYMQGYEDGKKLNKNATACIVENQQYYTLNKQIEYYKEYIEELRKENEELKISNKEIYKECSRLEKKEFELEKEIEERDKIINMMAEYIFYNQDFKFQGGHSIQDVKEYFAYKAYITYITKKEERNDTRRSEIKSSGKTKKRE